jgi:Cu(I)/Ag(I) efflux system membrane fusion protein
MKINIKNIALLVIVLATGLLIGWIIFSPSVNKHEDHNHSEKEKSTIWTCSMHPQIKLNKPGQCPICAMDLIPLISLNSTSDMDIQNIQMSEAAARLAEIQTLIIKKGNPIKDIHLQGKVQVDERRISEITARFNGRIEKLYLNFTGQVVKKGDLLAKVYSPELISAQQELLEAVKYKEQDIGMYKAALNKLKLWDITDEQINKILTKAEVEMYFNILSPISGTVSMRYISLGDYIKKGTKLFKVIDLSSLWLMFDAYESDLAWININDKLSFEIASLPGEIFTEKISYIDPFINAKTRVAKVRLEIKNSKNRIKPQMFAKGIIKSEIKDNGEQIIIPKSAILWTGKRAIVYIKEANKDNPTFTYREIILGPDTGDSYIVKKGLQEGEEIVVYGVFKIDASAQLSGLTSMMNPASDEIIIVNDKFSKQLNAFYSDYLRLKDALITSDINKTSYTIHLLHTSINKIDMSLLEGESHMEWMKLNKKLNLSISDIVNSKDLSTQRIAFANLSSLMFEAIKIFKISDVSYYHFCPMANNDKGAYWLSDTKEIRNPYFGDEMLECGEIKKVIR